MTLLQWKGEHSVCIDPVDSERRELIDLINRLHDELDRTAAESPASIAELLESISAHLALEEEIMRDQAYDDLASHEADHQSLIDNLCDLIIMHAFERPDDADCMELAQRLDFWFCSHFRTHNAKFQWASPRLRIEM
jgi:hemerythrin-like metal-binding protein